MVKRFSASQSHQPAHGDEPGQAQIVDRFDATDLGRARTGKDRDTERLLLRSLINAVPDYLFIKDTKSRFVVSNRDGC